MGKEVKFVRRKNKDKEEAVLKWFERAPFDKTDPWPDELANRAEAGLGRDSDPPILPAHDMPERKTVIRRRLLVANLLLLALVSGLVFLTSQGYIRIPGIFPTDATTTETTVSSDPTSIPTPTQRVFVDVATGGGHTIALTEGGRVFAAGGNEHGECDTAHWDNIVSIDAGFLLSAGIREDGTVVVTGAFINTVGVSVNPSMIDKFSGETEPLASLDSVRDEISMWTDIVAVRCGANHIAGIRSDGTVVLAGSVSPNFKGMGVTDWTNVTDLTIDTTHVIALHGDGTATATGLNLKGETDVEAWEDLAGVTISNNFSAGLREDGTVVAAGQLDRSFGDPLEWNDIVQIGAGAGVLLGLREDGTVTIAGVDQASADQVGQWRDVRKIDVGMYNWVGLLEDGSLVAGGQVAGENGHAEQLMYPDDTDPVLSPAPTPTPTLPDHWDILHAFLDDRGLEISVNPGIRLYGSIRLPEDPEAVIRGVEIGALLQDRNAQSKQYGLDFSGYLGQEVRLAMAMLKDPTDAFIPSSDAIIMLVTDTEVIGAWDDLAVNRTSNEHSDTHYLIDLLTVATPEDLADPNPENKRIKQAAVGTEHAIALLFKGFVIATGDNSVGQCDVFQWRDMSSITVNAYQTAGLTYDGTVRITGAYGSKGLDYFDTLADYEAEISSWTDIVQVACGSYHTVGVKSDGTVVATGIESSRAGTTALDVDGWRDIVAVAAGKAFTIGLKSDGTVIADTGNNFSHLQVGGWRNIRQIVCGDAFSAGLQEDGLVVVTTPDRAIGLDSVGEWRNIVEIAACGDNLVGLQKDGSVVVAGSNEHGEYDAVSWANISSVQVSANRVSGVDDSGDVVVTGTRFELVDLSALNGLE